MNTCTSDDIIQNYYENLFFDSIILSTEEIFDKAKVRDDSGSVIAMVRFKEKLHILCFKFFNEVKVNLNYCFSFSRLKYLQRIEYRLTVLLANAGKNSLHEWQCSPLYRTSISANESGQSVPENFPVYPNLKDIIPLISEILVIVKKEISSCINTHEGSICKISSESKKLTSIQNDDDNKMISKKKIRIKNGFSKYGLKKFLEAKNIAVDDLCDLLAKVDIPCCIAVLKLIGFTETLYKSYFPKSKDAMYKSLAEILDADDRNIRGNLNVLNPKSKENKIRYTSHTHLDEAEEIILRLQKGQF